MPLEATAACIFSMTDFTFCSSFLLSCQLLATSSGESILFEALPPSTESCESWRSAHFGHSSRRAFADPQPSHEQENINTLTCASIQPSCKKTVFRCSVHIMCHMAMGVFLHVGH